MSICLIIILVWYNRLCILQNEIAKHQTRNKRVKRAGTNTTISGRPLFTIHHKIRNYVPYLLYYHIYSIPTL